MYRQVNQVIERILSMITEEEKEELKKEIEKLKGELSDYLRIFPILGVSEKEKERVINQYLDDITIRQEKLKK